MRCIITTITLNARNDDHAGGININNLIMIRVAKSCSFYCPANGSHSRQAVAVACSLRHGYGNNNNKVLLLKTLNNFAAAALFSSGPLLLWQSY